MTFAGIDPRISFMFRFLLIAFVAMASAFMAPPTRTLQARATTMQSSSVVMELPFGIKLPKIDLGGIEIESFGDKWNAEGDLKLIPSDVQFKDTDGDVVTLRKTRGGRVDFFVGKQFKMQGVLTEENGTLMVTGKVTKGTPLSLLGFNLEDVVTESMKPADPEDLAKATALIG